MGLGLGLGLTLTSFVTLTETPWSKGRELCSPMSSCRSRNSFECARASATSSFTAVFSTARCARRERVASAVCCGAGGEKVIMW